MECIKKLHDTVETLDTLGRNCLNCIKCLMQICTASVVRHIIPLPTLFLALVFYSDISSVDRIVSDSLMIPWWFVSGYATHYLPITYPLPTHCLPIAYPNNPYPLRKIASPEAIFSFWDFFGGVLGSFGLKKIKFSLIFDNF